MNNTASKSHEHITPLRVYLLVGAALLLLTAVTVRISFIHLGPWNAVVALLIASSKALLVSFFFMHLIYDKKLYMVIFSIGIVILTIFITLTMADTLRRGEINAIEAAPINPAAKIYRSPAPGAGGHEADSTHKNAGAEEKEPLHQSDSTAASPRNQ